MISKNALYIFTYVVLSSFGLILLKIGTNNSLEVTFVNGNLKFSVNYVLLIGMLFYILSFITSLIAMKEINLNVFYPISAGLVYILVGILSFILLHEQLSIRQITGMVIILTGVLIMNINKA